MRSVGESHIGKVRSENQDTIFLSDQPVGKLDNLYIVADGMGGHRAGGYASSYAVSRFVDLLRESEDEDIIESMKAAIAAVNQEILEKCREDSAYAGMGTTIVVAIFMDNKLYVSHVGDSRAYILKDGQLTQITKDHTLVNELVDRGAITPESAKHHVQKNVLTQAIGAPTELKPSLIEMDFENSLLMLCSDGLYNCLDNEAIKEILLKNTKVVEKVIELIDQANENGGRDNIGVAIIDNQGGR